MKITKKLFSDLIAIVETNLQLDKECITIFSRKGITTLAVLAFSYAAVQGTASAALIQANENLNNNLVPTDFSLATTNTAGLANGRLEATAINGSASLLYNIIPDKLRQIDISYTGHFGYSRWGTYTGVSFGGLPINLTHGVNEYKHGSINYASISSGSNSTSPFNFSNFDYSITVVDGQVKYSGIDSATNTQAFNLTRTDASILLSDINRISFNAHNTTGSEPVWLDDINLQLHTVPVPATVWLVGIGLLGMTRFRKHNTINAA